MIDQKLVDNIRAYGVYRDSGEGRRRVLEDTGRAAEDEASIRFFSARTSW